MALVERLYRWLLQGPAPECDRILTTALAHAEQPYFDQIVRILLERACESSWAGLVQYYDRLSPETRDTLRGREQLLRAGIGTTIKSRLVKARQNALAASADCLDPRLAYLLPDAMRDDSRDVRVAAGRVLREISAAFLAPPRPCMAGGRGVPEYQVEREQLVGVLREGLRKFDLHSRGEAVEAALWFAADLGEALWEMLESHRSRCGRLADMQLESWNHPRLAAFLLLALARPQWRSKAIVLLRTWAEPSEAAALLEQGPLLADPQVRQGVAALRLPWIERLDARMSEVPAELRVRVPEWACCLGYRDNEKVGLLAKWVDCADVGVRRAVVYALAALGGERASAELKRIAAGDLPLARFAKWWLAGRQGRPARPMALVVENAG